MSDTTRAMPVETAGDAVGVRIEVLEGPDEGAVLEVTEPMIIGTSERADLTLTDPTVSRRHLEARPSGIGIRFVDADSRNGTWLDRVRVQEVELPAGAQLRVGNTVLSVTVAEARRVPATPGIGRYGRFLGEAKALSPLYRKLVKVVETGVTILLEGESGTGKELLAEAIHDKSPRADQAFVVVDCGSVPETLIESELFGHARGAFTGADSARTGAFEQANGGTLFLDEIGELPLPMQTRLLRVLDKRTVRRLGADKWLDVDVRVVAATNRNLEREVEEGRFRLDLFHRLSVIHLRIPPLRERAGDISLLSRAFAEHLGGDPASIEAEVARRAVSHSWPGNVRELRNTVERLVLLGDDAEEQRLVPAAGADTDDSSDRLGAYARSGSPYRVVRSQLISEFNKRYAEHMLSASNGNVSQAARVAGVARRHFYRLRDGGPEER